MSAEEEGFRLAVVKTDETMLPVPDMIAKAHVDNGVTQVEAVKEEPEGVHHSVAFIHDKQDCWSVTASSDSFAGDITERRLDLLTAIAFAQLLPEEPVRLDGFGTKRSVIFLAPEIKPLGMVIFSVIRNLPINSPIPIRPSLFWLLAIGLRDISLPLQPWRPGLYIIIAGQEDMATPFPLVQLVQILQRRMIPFRLNWSVIQHGSSVVQVFSNIAGPKLFSRVEMDEWGIVENIVGDLPPSPLIGIPLGLIIGPAKPP